jgi:putative membrane protein insertion efficiency factor
MSKSSAALPMIVLITTYQKLVSPMLGRNCRFSPTCSSYAVEALARFGLWRGGMLSIRRIGRCHPFHGAGFDPVPGQGEEP